MRLKGNVELYVDLKQFDLLKELAGITSDSALYIDFQIAEASQRAGKLVSLIEEQLKEGHSFAQHIKIRNPRAIKFNALINRTNTLEAWFVYILDQDKRDKLTQAGFFKDGRFVVSSLFREPPAFALLSSLRNKFFLERSSVSGQKFALSWFKPLEDSPDKLRYQSAFPIPNPDYYWSSSSISIDHVNDAMSRASDELKIHLDFSVRDRGYSKLDNDYFGNGYLSMKKCIDEELPGEPFSFSLQGGVFRLYKDDSLIDPNFIDSEQYPLDLVVQLVEQAEFPERVWQQLHADLKNRADPLKRKEALRYIFEEFKTTIEL